MFQGWCQMVHNVNIKLPVKGSELPMYHPKPIGEKNLLTNCKRHLTDDWQHKLKLLKRKRKRLNCHWEKHELELLLKQSHLPEGYSTML